MSSDSNDSFESRSSESSIDLEESGDEVDSYRRARTVPRLL